MWEWSDEEDLLIVKRRWKRGEAAFISKIVLIHFCVVLVTGSVCVFVCVF
jgi:hypothetical protein